jgi:transcriptional regulator GlxA family with amidase domain
LVVRNAYLGPDVFGLLSGALVPGGPSTRAPAHPAVQHAMRLLEAELAEPWTLDELGARVNLAPGYLIRLFGKSVGMSPMAYLTRIRAERAAGLLIETELPVATVGAMVGWHDPSHATRRFRSPFGLSPSRYRSAFRP